jgi:hemerythrin superfamily protein
MPDGIDLILADHERVNALFAMFRATPDGTIIGQVLDALAAHDDAEQAALYPLAANVLGDAALVTRALGAHSEMKVQIDLIRQLEGPPLVAAFQSLQEMVTAHVNDEEQNLLPALRARATAGQLDGLAARIEQSKQRVG